MQEKPIIWHPIGFITCHLLAILLYGSWLFPATRSTWDGIDQALFFTLNGSLEGTGGWSLFWAYANTKISDIVVGIMMILIFISFCFSGKKYLRVERLAAFGMLSGMILLSQDGGLVNFYEHVIDVSRQSPSLVLEPVVRLSQLYPDIHLKDAADSCFPGDHGVVIFIWLSCVWFYAGWRWGLFAIIFTVLVLLPRMVAGAHWLTDNLVGSATLVLLMDAWILCTPVGFYLHKLGKQILGFILPRSWA